MDLPLNDKHQADDERLAVTFTHLLDGLLHGLIPQERAPSTLVVGAWVTSREIANYRASTAASRSTAID